MDRLLNVLLAAMVFVTLGRIAVRGKDHPTTDHVTRIHDNIDALVHDGANKPSALSATLRGQCSYVVLFSANCAASQAAAHQWRQDLLADPEPFPEGWRIVWLNDSSDSASFRLPSNPVRVLFSAEGDAVRRDLRLRGYPSHVVLDREGRIVSGGMGSLLPPKNAFRNDCTIDQFHEAGGVSEP